MSPARIQPEVQPSVAAAIARVCVAAGGRIRDERLRRHWTLRELAAAAGVSRSEVQRAESGMPVSIDAYCRLSAALSLRVDLLISDPRRREPAGSRDQDPVHSAMGELEASRMQSFRRAVGVDEPYQHYQFAGRADLVAWEIAERALLHIENRTRFPNIQEAAGAWNGKRRYLATQLAAQLGVPSWNSITHVMAGLWTSEVQHVVRIRAATFRALCPDGPEAFAAWWRGELPPRGVSSSFVLLDPLSDGRERQFVRLGDIAQVRPRHRGYAEAARGRLSSPPSHWGQLAVLASIWTIEPLSTAPIRP